MKKIEIKEHEQKGITRAEINKKLYGTGCECLVAVSVIRNKKTGICYPIGYTIRGSNKLEKNINKAIEEVIGIY